MAETGAIYRKEQDDVDKLEKGGLRSFLLSLTGDKEERLTKERREAMAAKCQYDQAVSDLEYLENRLRELRGQQATLKHVRQRLKELSQEKAALLKELGGETGARLMELEQRQAAGRRPGRPAAGLAGSVRFPHPAGRRGGHPGARYLHRLLCHLCRLLL